MAQLPWIAAVTIAATTAAAPQSPRPGAPVGAEAGEAAYVVRGHQTEARQRAYHERVERFYQSLVRALEQAAPDLIAELSPPRPDVYGYQILPTLGTEGPPPAPGTKSEVMNYSWSWSDTLIGRQVGTIDRLETELAQAPRTGEGRAAFKKLASAYRTLVSSRNAIDYDIQYNWMWQKQIAQDRPTFDHLKSIQQHVLEREAFESALASGNEAELRAAATKWALESTPGLDALRAATAARAQAITQEVMAANGWAATRDFLRIEHPAPNVWIFAVPVSTDIPDPALVEGLRQVVERVWHVRGEKDGAPVEYRVRLDITTVSPEQLYCPRPDGGSAPVEGCRPPARGDHIDVEAHVARFPKGAVITTGAAATRFVDERAIVIGPHDLGPHAFAHEFGHVLGLPDAYFRGYKDASADGFVVTELTVLSDIMGAPGSGPVVARHFETMMATKARTALNLSMQLFQEGRYAECIEAARGAIALKPDYAEAYNNVAAAYAQQLRWDEAIDAAREAVRLKPDFRLARNNLAWAEGEKKKTSAGSAP